MDKILIEGLLKSSRLNLLYVDNFTTLQSDDKLNIYPMAQYMEFNNLNFNM